MLFPAITFDNVSFAYEDTPAVENVSFQIKLREFVCLVGPNGGGKTTLLKLMLGLLKPDTGSINVLGSRPEDARPRIGYLSQTLQFDPLFPISALDVVLLGCLNGKKWRPFSSADKKRALSLLDEVGLAHAADRPFAALSGGMRQRVLLARALAADPEILLLDEPTSMVDATSEDRLMIQLRELHERLTIVLVSHDFGFVSQLVQRVICVNRQVTTHALDALTGDTFHQLYGHPVAHIHHHHCSVGPATSCGCEPSTVDHRN